MRHIAIIGLATALVAVSPGLGRAAEKNGRQADHDFLIDAASGGQMEVELGKLAKTHASSDRVREFGRRMVDDHSKSGTELKQLATREKVKLPAGMKEEHRNEVNKLSQLRGAEFDQAYMKKMVEDHETDVAEFKKRSADATDPNVRAFAAKTLPTLESHLRMAKEISSTTGGTKAGDQPGGD